MFTPLLRVDFDDANERGETLVIVPPVFGRFDHAYCLTNHKSQGRTFDSAYVLVNPSMADRECSYVAASRSRFATTRYANRAALAPMNLDSHQPASAEITEDRATLLDKLAFSMSREWAKGTTLDRTAPAQNTGLSGPGKPSMRHSNDPRARTGPDKHPERSLSCS